MRPEMMEKIREWYILAIGAAVLIGGVAIASYQPGNVPGQAPASEVAQRQAELSKTPSTRQAAATRPESKTAQSSETSASEAHNHAGRFGRHRRDRTDCPDAAFSRQGLGRRNPPQQKPDRGVVARAQTAPGPAAEKVEKPSLSLAPLAMRPWGGRSIVNAKPAIPWNQARTRLAQASPVFSAGRPDRSPITTTRQPSRTRQLSGISRRSTHI